MVSQKDNPPAGPASEAELVLARRFVKEKGHEFRSLRGRWLFFADGEIHVDNEFLVERAYRDCISGFHAEAREMLPGAERDKLVKLAEIGRNPERQRGALAQAAALLRLGDEAVDPRRCEILSRWIQGQGRVERTAVPDGEALDWLVVAGHVGRVKGSRGQVEHVSPFTVEARPETVKS